MSVEGQSFYPGEAATPQELLALANEYRAAGEALLPIGRRGVPRSRAPYRLVAIHALELYLNAYLLSAGHSPMALRRLHHDFTSRTRLTLEAKLILRKRTLTHLMSLSEKREYLATRYDPAPSAASELNRLAATLAEVAGKVSNFINRSAS